MRENSTRASRGDEVLYTSYVFLSSVDALKLKKRLIRLRPRIIQGMSGPNNSIEDMYIENRETIYFGLKMGGQMRKFGMKIGFCGFFA